MPGPKVEILLEGIHHLGEGPHWSWESKQLYSVDAFRQHVYRYDPANKSVGKTYVNGGLVAFVIPVHGKKDTFMISRQKQICAMNWNGTDATPTKVTPMVTVEEDIPNNYFNDAKCDASGRLWSGTMAKIDPEVIRKAGSFYSIGKDYSVKKHFNEVMISNGMAWNSDNTIMHYIDSRTYRVDAFDFDLHEGAISNRRTVFDLKANGLKGDPDGMTIDTNGKLWVATFGGGKVLNIDPETGKLIGHVEFPCSNITSVTFGGPNYDVLYVTSALCGLDLDQIGKEPAAGSLFQVTGLGAKGFPAVHFGGSSA